MAESKPSGYLDPKQVRAASPLLPALAFAVLLAGVCVGAFNELVLHQPRAYLAPGFGAPRWAATLAALLGALAALVWLLPTRQRARADPKRLPFLLCLFSLLCASSAALLFASFESPGWHDALSVALPAAAAALLVAVLAAARPLLPVLRGLGAVGYLLHPFRLLAVALLLGAGAVSLTLVGLLRAAIALGLVLAVLAAWSTTLLSYLQGSGRRQPGLSRIAILLFVLEFAGFLASDRWVSIAELGDLPPDIVYTFQGRQRYVVTSTQESFELFADRRLKVSTLDAYRYFEALTHPALSASGDRREVLVLGAGEGLCAAEVLRWPDVTKLTLVTPDRGSTLLARRVGWLRKLNRAALESPKLELVEAEPIVWLEENPRRFGVIIIDLPEPQDFVEGKNYTRYFYESIARHLTHDGVAVAQATSPFRSPATFAAIRATIAAAGLQPLPYHAELATLGDWAYILMAKRRITIPRKLPGGELGFLDPAGLVRMFQMPKDLQTAEPGAVSTLDHQRVVSVFEREREREH